MNLPDGMIFSLSYTVPFIFLFIFISHQTQKKNLILNLSMKMSPWYIYLLIFSMMFSMMIVNEYISSLVPKNGPILGNMYNEIEHFLNEEIKNPIPFFSTTVLLAPICEEVFFRGVILNGMLRNKIHPINAILFSSFLFGLTHMNPWQFVGGLFIGNFIGFVYYVTYSIIDCILLHMFNNVFAILTMFFFMKNKKFIIQNRDQNYWILFSFSVFILIIGFLFLMKKKRLNTKNK
ncbi:CPBP family intramembrane glutamic endopeptidase [Blattabacterium cuenoti]|uniref:CPBP family intramembrane glutamic endopeptidase n=1 Tax=Blattabacterium cuenoti TaxID=1653831 RepID=UPI00293BDDA2|nr:CPBP family intramembrane glutamic endopeptidase [Blattabacterium cuenoti]